MVLAERGYQQDIRSGRRSRAASPNGHMSDGSSATDDSEHSMKIGDEYQAVVPEAVTSGPCPEAVPEKALLIWAPSVNISESKLDEYISMAKEKYGYNVEQALGMLFWHKYDIEPAIADLANFTPFPDEWTMEDKVLFEQAFQFHGKCFQKIRHMLPDKSISSLVKYYYSWKKVRTRTSLMDRQVRKLSAQKDDGSDAGSEAHSENESDFDMENKDNKTETKATCSNCNVVTQVFNTHKGNLCQACCQFLKRTGTLRSSSGSIRTATRHNPLRSKRKPPRGMHLVYEELLAVVTGASGEGDAILKSLDSEIISLKRQFRTIMHRLCINLLQWVQNNKQIIGQLKHRTSGGIDSLIPPEGGSRINARWSGDELLLAVQAIRKYGRNWKAVSEVIGTKTESHIRSFFVNYRRRYNLDKVLAEYDAEHGITDEPEQDEKMDIDRNGTATTNGNHPSSPGSSTAAPPLLLRPQSPAASPSVSNRLCPPPLQQANSSRGSSSRTLLQQPPPLICPSNINGSS